MDLYSQMGKELRALFKELFVPERANAVRQKMAQILATASQIGGSIKAEAEQLHADVTKYLQRPHDPQLVSLMKKHALKLEQETREI